MKALFFDIDGTLIDPNIGIMHVPESVKTELQRLKNLGHKLFIATGRPKAVIFSIMAVSLKLRTKSSMKTRWIMSLRKRHVICWKS